MTTEEIKELDLGGVLKRMNEIKDEADEEGADIEALEKEVDELTERKAALESAAETRKSIMRKVAAGQVGTVIESQKQEERKMGRTIAEIRSSAEYADAYANYIKTGDDRECRAIATELTDTGTVPVPTILQDSIETAWETAELFGLTSHIEIPGLYRVPYEDDLSDAETHTEGGDPVTEGSATIKDIVLTPESIMHWVTVTGEVLALNGVNFLTYIGQAINQKLAEKIDEYIVDAVKNSSFTQTLTGSADWQTLLSAEALLGSAAKNPVIACTKNDFFTGFMSATDTTERPIYNIISENGKPSYRVNGLKAYFTDALEDGTYIVGDFKGVLCNTPKGKVASYVVDNVTLAEYDRTKIVGKTYLAADVTKKKHFVLVSAAAAE